MSGAVLALTTPSLQDVIVVPPLVREGRKRSHIRRGSILPLLVLLAASPLPLTLEKEQGNGTNLKRRNILVHVLLNVTNVLSSSADEIPHDDEFNSHTEDHQDLVPEAEIHSNVSSEDVKFQNLIEEVFKLLPADRFPKKTDDVLGGNRPRSSIEMEMMKAPKKSISLPRSKCPLTKTIVCIKQSLGAVEVDGSYPMPPTIAQDWLPSRAVINKLVNREI